jgi:hypothetical protein
MMNGTHALFIFGNLTTDFNLHLLRICVQFKVPYCIFDLSYP